MKLKRSLLCLLTAACLLLAAAAPALAEGTSDDQGLVTVGFMDDSTAVPPLSTGAWDVFEASFAIRFPSLPLISVEEMATAHGTTAATQYVNCINYYFDTGKDLALSLVHDLIKDPWNDYANGVTPIQGNIQGNTNLFIASYVPGSASPASAAPVTEAPFPDVPTDAWYAKAVSEMKDSGIIEGCNDGQFHPERPVTIGEFYAMLVRAITSTRIDATVATGVSNDTHWANGVLENAAQAFLSPPKEPGHADDPCTRGEAVSRTTFAWNSARTVSKYAKNFQALWTWTMARERTEGNMTLADIPDHATVEQYLLNEAPPNTENWEIVDAYNYGITKGIDEAGTFNPYGTLTRAEVVQLLYNTKFTWRTGAIPDGQLL